MGSIHRQRWFRRPNRVVQPARLAYPRIVSAPDSPRGHPALDLFAFDASSSPGLCDARVQEIVPVASVEADEVLRLAAHAWPEEHPVACALVAAFRERFGADAMPERCGMWHLSAGRGIQGYLNGFHVLIGNEQLMRDGGVPLPQDVRERLARYETLGWYAVLIGARASGADREDVHRSLIGLLAVAPEKRIQELPEPAAPCVDRGAGSAQSSRSRRLPWWTMAFLGLGSGLAGVYWSALTVQPDEVAVVRRLGHVAAVCEPGLHFRWLWPVEQVTRVRRGGVRLWQLEQGRIEYRIADLVAYASAPRDPEGLLAQFAEFTMREALAARPASQPNGPGGDQALADLWRRRLEKQLGAAGLGFEVMSVTLSAGESHSLCENEGTGPGGAGVSPACEGRLVNEAGETLAPRVRPRPSHTRSEPAGVEAPPAVAADNGKPGESGLPQGVEQDAELSPEEARLQLIRELMTGPLPGRRVKMVNPELGSGCRIYLRRGWDIQAASVWNWPTFRPDASEGLETLAKAIEGYRASMDRATTLVLEASNGFFGLLEREPAPGTRPAE